MISPATCVTMIMFAGSGLYLYQAKHHAEVETREIRRLLAEADATRQRAAVLITDYQLENDPELLSELAARFQSQLKPTQPTQFTTPADLEHRLPPVGLPAPALTSAETDLAYVYPPAPSLVAGPPAPASLDAGRQAVATPKAGSGAAEAAAAKPKPAQARPAVQAAQLATREPAIAAQEPSQYAFSGHPGASTPVSPTPLASHPAQPQYSPVVSTTPMYPFGAQYASPYGGPTPSSGSSLGMARMTTPRPYVQTVTPPLAPGGSGG